MKILLNVAILLLFCVQSNFASPTQRVWLSGQDAATAVDWEFKVSAGRNSGVWSTIPVPSNWELHGFGNYTYGYGGAAAKEGAKSDIGYYRTTFTLDTEANKGRVFELVFAGSTTDTKATLNGKSVGATHQGGVTQFSYDVTDLVKTGENILEVEVRKLSANEKIFNAENIGDYWLFGGIFRPVYIDIKPQGHIERVAIDATMEGVLNMDVHTSQLKDGCKISTQLYDAEGNKVGKPTITKVIGGCSRVTAHYKNVALWSDEFPNLYRAEVTIKQGNKVLHTYNQKFGFRTFEVRDYDGFYLNGKRILLKGASAQGFVPNSGRSLSKEDMLAKVKLAKQLNFNTIRASHFSPDDYFLDVCDSLGLLTMAELTGWHAPLGVEQGTRLVKEMIMRDVNHPSIVLWSNGNHISHTPELDEVFFKWDIQKRRPLKNAAKNENIFAKYSPNFDIIDTRYYPSYDQLIERLKENHIVLPNETIHALYDGGGAANLTDFWSAIRTSKVGGGLMIWALMDEGIIRTDKANFIDLNGNAATDGIVGPFNEWSGSCDAVREIWSPIQLITTEIDDNFDGVLKFENRYLFTKLNQCQFRWSLINFTSPMEASKGHRVQKSGYGVINGDDVSIHMPANWQNSDALRVQAYDPHGHNVYSWVLPIASRKELAQRILFPHNYKIVQDDQDSFTFRVGELTYNFDAQTGRLLKCTIGGKVSPVSNVPSLVAMNKTEVLDFNSEGKVSIETDGAEYLIKSRGVDGFTYFEWRICRDGSLDLNYEYSLPEGDYRYAGLRMEVDNDKIVSKKMLAEGEFRIWANRREGGLLDVWEMEKLDTTPNEKWGHAEFEGFFSPWYWALFRSVDETQFAVATTDENIVLGVLNPINGKDAKNAVWQYPAANGVFLFNAISGVGSKWKPIDEFGPSAQATHIDTPLKGSFKLNCLINNEGSKSSQWDISIE